ncbi:hypothetical protein J2S41_000190 [Catenuloplanes atrovinosus]|uniref:Uncharacterized protein n=1 Tax=Catenuloplanes atrovinosus TaxID=137266 RepID=A0AAE3YI76_9ACTN|nr:hypothetical protein [Catenuloplanes atrovinosus]
MHLLMHLTTGASTAVAVGAVSAAVLGGACLRVRPRPWLPRATGHIVAAFTGESADRCRPAGARPIGQG